MEPIPLPDNSPRNSWLNRLQAIFEILLISGLISSFLAMLPLSAVLGRSFASVLDDVRYISLFLLLESVISFLILAALLKVHRENLRSLGLHWERWKDNSALGLALIPLLFLINALVSFVFRNYLPKYYIDQNPLVQNIRSLEQLVLFITAALIAGGFKEELQRAFILNKFRRHLGGATVGLVLWSLAFGAGHYVQGMQGVFVATIYGFLFGLVYLVRGSLIAPIVAHAVYDMLALLGYWWFTGRFK